MRIQSQLPKTRTSDDINHLWQATTGLPNCKLCNLDYSEAFSENECHKAVTNYCSDESPRSLLNEVVAKLPTELHEAFERCLLDELGGLDYLEAWIAYSVATAEMIARVCVEAHQGDINGR